MEVEALLAWARGPGFEWALLIMFGGITLRLIEIATLGRKRDLSLPREGKGSGWRTIVSRFFSFPLLATTNVITYVAGYIFHLGLLIIIFFLVPHIEVWRGVLPFTWGGLPTTIIDLVTVLTMVAMGLLLFDRLTHPVKRLLSTAGDYLAWTVTFLPLLTGYCTYHHLFFDYSLLLALHILSVELLMVVFPFSKLIHALTTFSSRWFTGEQFGHKGVTS
ncbi:MAG: hypothetical protein HQL48_01665 [Gammaproteobacteria bacterium]|nr:hypothetical protein [Gammaproteobacteria bacterium]